MAFNSAKERTFDEALLRLFAAPDVAKSLLESARFKSLISSIQPSLRVPTVKRLNSRLWEKFHATICAIRRHLSNAEFIIILFDGWPTV